MTFMSLTTTKLDIHVSAWCFIEKKECSFDDGLP